MTMRVLLLALLAGAAAAGFGEVTEKMALGMVDEECRVLESTPLQHEGAGRMMTAKVRSAKKLQGPRDKAKEAAAHEGEWLSKIDRIANTVEQLLEPITEEGYKVHELPRGVVGKLRAAYENGLRDDSLPGSLHAEESRFDPMKRGLLPVMDSRADKMMDKSGQYHIPTTMVDLNKCCAGLIRDMNSAVKPMIEEWVGAEKGSYEHTMSYGARSYTKGAFLRTHTDQLNTHVVSVIVNIACKGIEEQWPLRIKNHEGEWNTVYLKPGQMLFYESAKLRHERMYPFNGTSMVNLFTHFRPPNWLYEEATFTEEGQLGWNSKDAYDAYHRRLRREKRAKKKGVQQDFERLRVTPADQTLLRSNGIRTSADLRRLRVEDMRKLGLGMGTRNRIARWSQTQ